MVRHLGGDWKREIYVSLATTQIFSSFYVSMIIPVPVIK